MAAYAALVSLLNDLELIPNHPIHSFSFDSKQITSLSQTLHFLIDFMETYDSHGCTRHSAEILESRIASAAHAAHDVIESHIVDQIHAGSTLAGKTRSYFLLDLHKAIANMDFVKRKAMQFQAKSGVKTKQPTYSAPLSSRGNLMVGFDGVVVRLMEMLIGESSPQRVIPVVGMGGLGKTTLTRNVYEHLNIVHHFDIRLWATISQEYSVENILRELLFGERKSTIGGIGNVSVLGEELHKKLWGRRYLVVLDDMWSVEAWDEVRLFLPDNGNGSCVIVTTRLSPLAAHLSYSPFEMNFLGNDESWELFCGESFGEENCPAELEEIGKKIVKRCRGLPLAIVVIGGHFRRSSRAVDYWNKFANLMNPISSLGDDNQCLNIINLSYEHLPTWLKPCFLYLGTFREDAPISSDELIKYWVAEGFLKSKEGLSLEEVAEDYLQDLIDRNLILVKERRWNGKAEYCGVHDIVRELCMKVGKKEKFMCRIDIHKERRMVIPMWELEYDVVRALKLAPLLRSLWRVGKSYSDDLPVELRLLRLSANAIIVYSNKNDSRCLPATTSQQVNLRYLRFSCESSYAMRYYCLPSSISLFWNIQTLTIETFGELVRAPYEIWEMTQLRCLEFHSLFLPDPLPEECIVLQNLHTLVGVENFRLSEGVCIRMPNIKKLSIKYYYFPEDCDATSYYCPHNLCRLKKLESLKCVFGVGSNWLDVVLSFTFPTSLEELCLWNCPLDWDELTMMIKSLPNLASLELNSVRGSKWDLVEVEFPCLKILTIDRCDDLIYWNANNSHYPVLEILRISYMPKLSEIPFDIEGIPTLGSIQLNSCSVSAAVSAMRIMVERESLGNEDLRLDVHFRETEKVESFRKILQEESLSSNSLRLHLMRYVWDKYHATARASVSAAPSNPPPLSPKSSSPPPPSIPASGTASPRRSEKRAEI